jgi:uncharacterized protein (DUF342 family)
MGIDKKATQKATHSPIRMIPQEVARGSRVVFGKGPRQERKNQTEKPASFMGAGQSQDSFA